MVRFPHNEKLYRYNDLRKFYINLDSRPDRRASMEAQVGDSFERVSACYAKDLSPVELADRFALAKSRARYGIELTRGQMGCTISHFELYRKIAYDPTIGQNDWVLISEDDNWFIDEFDARLNQAVDFLMHPRFARTEIAVLRYYENTEFFDYSHALFNYEHGSREVHVNHPDLEPHVHGLMLDCIKPRKKRKYSDFGFLYNFLSVPKPTLYSQEQHFICPAHLQPWSSALYLIRKSACLRLVTQNLAPWWITDDFQNIFDAHRIFIASPFFAIGAEGVSESDIQDHSALNNAQKATLSTPQHQRVLHKQNKKLIAKALKYYYSHKSRNRNLARMFFKFYGASTY